MSKDNIVKFPGVKQNKHLTMKNELEAKMVDIEEYIQYMTDMIIEQLIMDGYSTEDTQLINDLTVTINMLCGSLSRVEGVPHFTHEILDAMHVEISTMIDEEDEEE
tara:strand:- start:2933 stop:3250 length:318 start_codon:yes stop_codon:yes gene_type:complete